jgi:SAM-dependent methyltransferase
MQQSIRNFTRLCAKHLPIKGPIYEFGAYRVENVPEENLRPLFPGIEYIGSDMRDGPGVDQILDLHNIDLPDDMAECVLCLDTLEHVEYPRHALAEINRILSPGGIAIISSVFEFPIHNHPNDYWRFTPEGFRSLLQDFRHSEIFSFGRSEVSPQCVVGVGFKSEPPDLEGFLENSHNWEKWNSAILEEMIKSRQHRQSTEPDSC